jgi:predicted nucleic acid-binding protein
MEQLRELTPPLLTCWPVITEAAWLMRRQPAAVGQLLANCDAGLLKLLTLDGNAPAWIAAFLERYRGLGVQIADAALMYLAEREGIQTVFTLDRRDFSVYRLSRNRILLLIP